MRRRIEFRREVRIQPRGLPGCLLTLLGLAGMGVFVIFVVLPMLTIALGIALGLVLAGAIVYGYFRIKWALRRRFRRGDADDYEAEVIDDPRADAASRPKLRMKVQVRRRPPSP